MSSIKRAGLYVIRHKVKSLILLLVLTIIATFVLTGIAIQSSAKDAAKDVRGSVSGKIVLGLDTSSKNMKAGESTQYGSSYQYNGDTITDETMQAISNTEGVTDYNASSSAGLFAAAVNFKYLPVAFDMNIGKFGGNSSMTPTLFSEKFSGFTNGQLELIKGRHIVPEDEHVILISNELAEYNNLSVGDILGLYIDYSDKIVDVEIIGIFTGTEGGSAEDFIVASMRPGNQCVVDYTTKNDAYGPEYSYFDSVDIFVEDPAEIQNVYDRIANLPQVKGKTFTLGIDTEEYEVIANPLESLQSLVSTLIIVISAVSVAVLALLLTIWTRGRVRETGILMSIGINKPKIVGQFILETVLIAVLAFGLAYPSSNLIADKSGEFIMGQVVDAQNLTDSDSQRNNGSFSASDFDLLSGKPSAENAIKEINVTVTPDYLIWVFAIGTLLIVCAVLIASYTVMRLKPREILSKMS
jgi:putative ABC transport system permease protein